MKSGEMAITHCPTKQMVADFLTKPLQGNLFCKFRSVLLGHKCMDSISEGPSLETSKEHVGNCEESPRAGMSSGNRKGRHMEESA